MGRDKAALVWHGQPLWLRQWTVLRQFAPNSFFVSARAAPSWLPSEATLILDEQPSRGPLSGIALALHLMQTTHLLALAVDLPRVTAAHLRTLAGLAAPECGVIPSSAGRFEPLAAIYPKAASAIAAQALKDGKLALQSFANALVQAGLLRTYPITESELSLYHNVNTPADLSGEPRAEP